MTGMQSGVAVAHGRIIAGAIPVLWTRMGYLGPKDAGRVRV